MKADLTYSIAEVGAVEDIAAAVSAIEQSVRTIASRRPADLPAEDAQELILIVQAARRIRGYAHDARAALQAVHPRAKERRQ